MKISFLLVVLFFISSSLFAQITIQNTDVQSGGNIYELSSKTTTIGSIDPTPTDTNFFWDYSFLTKDATIEDTFLIASKIPLVYNFYFLGFNTAQNAANLNLGLLSITNICNIYKNATSKYDFWGYGGKVSGVPAPFYCTPHDVIYQFPMQYNNHDSSDSKTTASIPGLFKYTQYRHRVNHVDGWGELRTPKGIFNCLRLKSLVSDIDSFTVDTAFTHLPIALSFGIPVKSVEYKWLVNGQGDPMLQINQSIGFTGATTNLVRWQNDSTYIPVTTGSELITANNKPTIFPNPANIFCSIYQANEWENATLNVFDLTGQLIYKHAIKHSAVDYLPTYNWANGVYLITIESAEKSETLKLVVKH
jgi:hypothetical protein